jgi:hypothetical protein
VRKAITKQVETEVLIRCKRRCAVCYGLNLDTSIRKGQIAHIDKNSANNALDNLVFLCFDHHDEYDSRNSQSKSLTEGEIRHFQDELITNITKTWRESSPFNITPLIDINNFSGHYVREASNVMAELDIRAIGHNQIEVSGLVFWGTDSPSGPNIGQVDFKEVLSDKELLYIDQLSGYVMHISFTQKGLLVEEKNIPRQSGMGFSFAGEFRRSEQVKQTNNAINSNFEIRLRDGNIFLSDNGDERQLTFWGLDKNPFLLNNGTVLFVRQEEAFSPSNDRRLAPRKYYTHQLLSVDIKTTFEKIITSQKPFEDGLDGTTKILQMRSPTLSADQTSLYFVTEKYVTASQFVKVNVDTGEWIELFSAESFELIPQDDDICLFLVAVSEIRNRGRDIYYKLCTEFGKVLKEFDTQDSMMKYKDSLVKHNS